MTRNDVRHHGQLAGIGGLAYVVAVALLRSRG